MKNQIKEKLPNNLEIKIIGLALAGIGVFLGIKAIKNVINNAQQNNEIKKLDDGTPRGLATEYAMTLYSAFFQSGAEWISDWFGDGTNQKLVYEVGKSMYKNNMSLTTVSKSYKNLYNRILFEDLQKELSADEQAKFRSIISSGLGVIHI